MMTTQTQSTQSTVVPLTKDKYFLWREQVILQMGEEKGTGSTVAAHLRGKQIVRPEDLIFNEFFPNTYPTVARQLLKEANITRQIDRRRSLHLQPVTGSDSDDEYKDSSTDPGSDQSPDYLSLLSPKDQIYFCKELDIYVSAMIVGLQALFSKIILRFLSPPVLRAVQADSRYLNAAADQDVFMLLDIIKTVCLRDGIDRLSVIEVLLDLNIQTADMAFADWKYKQDSLLEEWKVYNNNVPMEDRIMCQRVFRSIQPQRFAIELKKYHGKTVPGYEALCSELQASEDADLWTAQNQARFHLSHSGGNPAPPASTALSGSLLLAGVSTRTPLYRNDRGTLGDYNAPHCPHCAIRTMNYYPHTAAQCHNPPSGDRVPKKIMAAMIAQYHTEQRDIEKAISRSNFEALP
jgi:hypothetical protein